MRPEPAPGAALSAQHHLGGPPSRVPGPGGGCEPAPPPACLAVPVGARLVCPARTGSVPPESPRVARRAPCPRFRSYSVDASEVTELHVVSYEVERDLTPLILSNCQYRVERGGQSLQEFDLEKIQRQLSGRFLQGKPRLTLRGLPTLVFRRDWNYEQLFTAVRSKVPQVRGRAPPRRAGPTPASPPVPEPVPWARGAVRSVSPDPRVVSGVPQSWCREHRLCLSICV